VLGAGEVAAGPYGPQPRYGGLWRVYKVFLPGSAGPFHGAEHPAARDRATDPPAYEGRYALDMSCFNDDKNFPDSCVWLDSQEKLETVLGELLADPRRREELGRKALETVRENLGGIERTVDMIVKHLEGGELYIAPKRQIVVRDHRVRVA